MWWWRSIARRAVHQITWLKEPLGLDVSWCLLWWWTDTAQSLFLCSCQCRGVLSLHLPQSGGQSLAAHSCRVSKLFSSGSRSHLPRCLYTTVSFQWRDSAGNTLYLAEKCPEDKSSKGVRYKLSFDAETWEVEVRDVCALKVSCAQLNCSEL